MPHETSQHRPRRTGSSPEGLESSGSGRQPGQAESSNELVEGVDYVMEGGYLVFTRYYLLKRGYCCRNGCRHCPYGPDGQPVVKS